MKDQKELLLDCANSLLEWYMFTGINPVHELSIARVSLGTDWRSESAFKQSRTRMSDNEPYQTFSLIHNTTPLLYLNFNLNTA